MKLIYGVGINDASYSVALSKRINGKKVFTFFCPYYRKWVDMLRRCYSGNLQSKSPRYKGCYVCEEWKYFSNFKRWMEQQDWEGKDLDKDFLVEGNRTYSPSACIFIPQKVNKFVTTSGKMRGDYPLGVYYQKKGKDMINERKNPYSSRICDGTGRRISLGLFSTPEEAHQRYLIEKLSYCNIYLEEFKEDTLIVKGLERIKNKICISIESNTELLDF